MDIDIKIKESQREPYGSFISTRQEKLQRDIKALTTQYESLASQIEILIQEYKDNQITLAELGLAAFTEQSSNGHNQKGLLVSPESQHPVIKREKERPPYKKRSTYWEKISYLFRVEMKAFTGNEIISRIYDLEPELKQASDAVRKKVEVNVYSTLSHKVKNGILMRVKVGDEYKNGFPNWFDEKKNLKKEFL